MAKVTKVFTIHVTAGNAQPTPPLGPTLGQNGINIGLFTKEFNETTMPIKQQYAGAEIKVPAVVTLFDDKSFKLEIQPPLTSHLILYYVKQKEGSGEPNKKKIGKISREDLRKIAEVKKPVMNTDDMEAIMKSIAGTAKNMGVEVEA